MKTQDRLEPGTPADADEIARMSRQLIERGLAWRWTAPRVRAALRDEETASVVARRNAELLGFALMSYDFQNRRAHLLLLAVASAARGRGLGRQLVGWLEKIGRVGGIARVELEVREDAPGAQEFYRRLGYHAFGLLPRYYEERLAAVKMARIL